MTTQTAIVLFAIWLGPVAAMISKYVTNKGLLLAYCVALTATYMVMIK